MWPSCIEVILASGSIRLAGRMPRLRSGVNATRPLCVRSGRVSMSRSFARDGKFQRDHARAEAVSLDVAAQNREIQVVWLKGENPARRTRQLRRQPCVLSEIGANINDGPAQRDETLERATSRASATPNSQISLHRSSTVGTAGRV